VPLGLHNLFFRNEKRLLLPDDSSIEIRAALFATYRYSIRKTPAQSKVWSVWSICIKQLPPCNLLPKNPHVGLFGNHMNCIPKIHKPFAARRWRLDKNKIGIPHLVVVLQKSANSLQRVVRSRIKTRLTCPTSWCFSRNPQAFCRASLKVG
jgi:hypothetical protein